MKCMLFAVLLLAIPTLLAQPDRFGLPACDAPTQHLATRVAFTLCFDAARKVPTWSAYQLTPEMLTSPAAPRQHFRRDPDLPSATDADYRNSGFHRSHVVPAADLAANPQALRDSYRFTNAIPQLPELNLSAWRKIENDIRKLAAHSDALLVVTGTLFDCPDVQRIGPNQVSVPCATFKVVLALQAQSRSAYAVILPNQPGAAPFYTTIREVETRSGLDFFSALPPSEQAILESTTTPLR